MFIKYELSKRIVGAITSFAVCTSLSVPAGSDVNNKNEVSDSIKAKPAIVAEVEATEPEESILTVENLEASTISVSSVKVEWTQEKNVDYEISCTPISGDFDYVENITFDFPENSKCYITGLREGTTYKIVVNPISYDGTKTEESVTTVSTESVEVIEEFAYEDGWTNCFAYEKASGLTLNPSWGAIQGCSTDVVTDTGIMRNEYGDYCVAMGTEYGYCNDRFLVELMNGVQFTVKICDSKGDRAYHTFGDDGKCIIEFIHDDNALPPCVAYTGNYGNFNWDGLKFDNIMSIKKINYGDTIEY